MTNAHSDAVFERIEDNTESICFSAWRSMTVDTLPSSSAKLPAV